MSIAETEITPFALPSVGSALGGIGSTIGSFFGGPIGGYAILALLVAFGGVYAYERVQIHALNVQIATLQGQIDGPSGYVAQIGRINANLATAQANEKDAEGKIAGLNTQIDKLATDSAAAVKRTETLQKALSEAQDAAARIAATLAANKPAQPSYAALTGLIKQPVAP